MRPRTIVALVVISILLIVFVVVACNRKLTTTYYNIDAPEITTPLKIAVITDLHSTDYGNELSDAVSQENPDIVLLVGDIFDNHYDNTPSWHLVETLVAQYPCYYVTGNHEMVHSELTQVLHRLQDLGVYVLQGNSRTLTHDGVNIRICGVDDNLAPNYETQLHKVSTEFIDAEYNILLSHRPNGVELYKQTGADLIISGHAHGGQWSIPWILPNGLYAPHQGLFPKYTNGLYYFDDWTLLVSRGLDKQSVKYPRIFNRPELVILTLQ